MILELIEWSLSAVLFYATADLNFGRHVELMKEWQLIPFERVSTNFSMSGVNPTNI